MTMVGGMTMMPRRQRRRESAECRRLPKQMMMVAVGGQVE